MNLALLDLQMPQKNGIQVVEETRAYLAEVQKQHENILILEPEYVFLTAFSTKALVAHLKKLKVKKCFEKPVSTQCMLDLINSSHNIST